MEKTEPAYIRTHASGALSEKIRDSRQILENCELCPRRCGVNRLAGETGLCKTPEEAQVSSFNAHFGEEAPWWGETARARYFSPTAT